MKKGFTIVELVIVIAIISILAAVLVPSIVNDANNAKQEIIDIYNGQTVRMIDNETGEILYEGKGTSETGTSLSKQLSLQLCLSLLADCSAR